MLDKREGQTPLQALEAYRAARPELAGVPMTYAGRLDPMASGKLIILIGDECKRRDVYTSLDKEYEFDVLFGIESDTGDILGLPSVSAYSPEYADNEFGEVSRRFEGCVELPYPVFSSKTVRGKPLYQYALEGRLDEIEIPRMVARVYGLHFRGSRSVRSEGLLSDVLRRFSSFDPAPSERLGSDFRKAAIRKRWRDALGANERTFHIASFCATVSSGTYIRSLAPALAKRLGSCGIAYSIRRTRIGRYRCVGRWGVWTRTY